MKKILAFAAAVAVSAVSAFALDVAVGARGAFGMGLGTDIHADGDEKLDMGKSLNFGGAIFGKIGITEQISVQPEIGFTHHTVGEKMDDYKGTVGFNTLDIPVLVGYNLEVMDGFTVTPFLGPQLSFALGKGKFGGDFSDFADDVEFKSPLLFDVVLGANCAYEVGPGAIVADLRYNLGLIALKEKESEEKLVTPRALGLSLGYQLKLGE